MTKSKRGAPDRPAPFGPRQITIGGRPLAVLLAEDERELVTEILGRLVTEIATYESFPTEALDGDITSAVERGVRLFLATLSAGRMPEGDELVELGESAARRAEERVPLAAVLAAYAISVRVSVEHVSRAALPEETDDLVASITLALDFLATASGVVADRYLEERQMIADVATDEEHALLRSLLDQTYDPSTSASPLAPSYEVVRLAVGLHPDELGPEPGAAVAAHRKLRRLRAALHDGTDRHAVLSSLGLTGGIALVPQSERVDDASRAALATRVARMADAAGAPIVAAAVTGSGAASIAPAAVLAGEVLDLLLLLDRPPGVYRLDDVAVEYQLSRPGPARTLLAASIAPLVSAPDLLVTLRSFLGHGQNRRQTALALHLHPNTVDYRMHKVATLTGLDPTVRADALALAASLVAHDAETADASTAPPAS